MGYSKMSVTNTVNDINIYEKRNDIVIIDGNNIAHKAINTKKEYFISIINKCINKFNPSYFIICFDEASDDNFRRKLYPEYKLNRSNSTNTTLHDYLDNLKLILYNNNIPIISHVEGDDIICTMANLFNGWSYIVSEDKDLLQLVDNITFVYSPSKRLLYDNKSIFKLYNGLNSSQIKYVKALAGDVSDNIKGVKGIGNISAIKLLLEYDTLDGIYQNIDNIKNKSIRTKLIEQKEMAYLSLELTTLRCNIINNYDFEKVKRTNKLKHNLANCYKELEKLT